MREVRRGRYVARMCLPFICLIYGHLYSPCAIHTLYRYVARC